MLLRISARRLAIAAPLATPVAALWADESHQDLPLISPGKLQERLTDPKVRLLDARPKADYDPGPIPGAVRVDTQATQRRGASELARDEAAWARTLAPLRIDEATESGSSPRCNAAKLTMTIGNRQTATPSWGQPLRVGIALYLLPALLAVLVVGAVGMLLLVAVRRFTDNVGSQAVSSPDLGRTRGVPSLTDGPLKPTAASLTGGLTS